MRIWVLIGILATTTVSARASSADIFIEPEIGVRSFTGDAGKLLDPGVLIGGTFGFEVAPTLQIVAHGDISFHGGGPDTVYAVDFDRALVYSMGAKHGYGFSFSGGGRLFPLGGRKDRSIQPYLGAEGGFSIIVWKVAERSSFNFDTGELESSDGMGSINLGGEAGLRLRTGDRVSLLVGAKLIHHFWLDETTNGFITKNVATLDDQSLHRFAANEFAIHARLAIGFNI